MIYDNLLQFCINNIFNNYFQTNYKSFSSIFTIGTILEIIWILTWIISASFSIDRLYGNNFYLYVFTLTRTLMLREVFLFWQISVRSSWHFKVIRALSLHFPFYWFATTSRCQFITQNVLTVNHSTTFSACCSTFSFNWS